MTEPDTAANRDGTVQEPQSPAPLPAGIVRFARTGILLAILAAGGTEAYVLANLGIFREAGNLALALVIGLPVLAMAAGVGLLRAGAALQVNVVLLGLSILIPLYGVEGYLTYSNTQKRSRHFEIAKIFADQAGRPFDSRGQEDVLADMRKQNPEYGMAAPNSRPYFHPDLGAVGVAPGIANVPVVACNEGGTWISNRTDEFGFLNPQGIWPKKDISVLAVGDSFTQGVCVPIGQDIVGRIRKVYPNSLSLGVSGTNPAFYHAMLLEYGQVLRPRAVIFNWFEGNDVSGLREDVADPLWTRYIGRTERVGIYEKQPEIDRWKREISGQQGSSSWKEMARQTLLLVKVRQLFGLGLASTRRPVILDMIKARLEGVSSIEAAATLDKEAFRRLIQGARDAVAGWGGKLVFVYLPGWERYCDKVPAWAAYCVSHGDYSHDDVIAILRDLQVETVDMTEIFAGRDLARLFYYPGSHYSPEGYGLVADAVLAKIGALPPASGQDR